MVLRLCASTVCLLHIVPKKLLLVGSYRSLFTRCLLPTAGEMKSQSSITSFFSAKSKKPSDAENADDAASKSGRVKEERQLSPKLKGKRPAADVSDSDSASPVKKPRRRRAVIESDSDEDAARDGSGAKSPSVKCKGSDKEPARQKSGGSPHGAGKSAGDESVKSEDERVSANDRGCPLSSPEESVPANGKKSPKKVSPQKNKFTEEPVLVNGKTSPKKVSPQKNKFTEESVPVNGKESPKKAATQKSKSVPLRKTARKKPIRSVATEEEQMSVISQVAPELLASVKPDLQSSASTDEPEEVRTNGDSHVTGTAEENEDEEMSSQFSKEKEESDAPKVQAKAGSKAATKKESSPKAKVEQRPSAGIFGKLSGQETGAGGKSAADDGNQYDPSRSKYHPVKHAVWGPGDKVPYLALARTFELVESISGRLKTIEVVSNYFRSVMILSPDDLLPSVYLCLNQLAPAYHGVELGIGDTVITRALAQATGRTPDKIKRDVAEKGDLGLVAESSKSNQRVMFRPAALTVQTVFRTLKEIAQLSGHSVMNKKVGKIQSLLVACRHAETRFVVRSLTGKLRIGLAEQSVLHALGQACAMTPPGQQLPLEVPNQLESLSADKIKASIDHAAMLIKTAHCECPTYDEIIPVLLEHGVEELPKHCRIRPGVPLKPMLAHPTKGVSEVLSRFEGARFTCEYKYDGERAQIHLCEDGTINVYSRNQENNTTKYPDIIARFRSCLTPDVKTCILDTEAVAWDTEKQQILPFQVLSTRKRKDADSASIKIQVQVFAFDLLYLNGESLVADTFQTRRDKLRSSFKAVDGEFTFAKSMDSNNVEEMAEFLDESVKGNCEGLMVKTLERDATYEIAKRSRNWLKLKKDYLEGVGDTIDVVVIGGFLGKGKRAGVYGGFLLACYDPENEEFQSICKIGTGFSDEDLQQHSAFFKDHLIESAKSYYRYSVEPDHWFDAVQVWEIKCADLSVSPVHKAAVGLVDPERGISLRFPRFLRVRDDKPPEQATSAQQVADMYNGQDQVKNQTSSGRTVDEEDFY